MKYLTVSLIAIICWATASAQTYEIGLTAGGLNYTGDVGNTRYIAPNTVAVGGVFRWNRSRRHSYRASLLVGEIAADDDNSDEPLRKQRGYNFSGPLIEGSLGMEFTFWEFDMTRGFGLPGTPYLYTGVNVFYHHEFGASIADNGAPILVDGGRNINFSIPITLGYKKAIAQHWVLSAEIGARYALADNLDGSVPAPTLGTTPFGNPNTNDWYMYSGIIISYTFGRRPCYCGF